MILGTLLLALVLGATLLFVRRPLWAGAVSWLLVSIAITGGFGNLGSSWLWVALMWLIPMALFGPTPLRSAVVTPFVFKLVAPILPRMSQTEKDALDAGTVWWDGELFSGAPDWKRLFNFKPRDLTPEEEAFLAGPVNTVCSMLTDWEVNQAGDLPKDVWDYLKREGFLGLIIPKEYGGKGFSAYGHSAVIARLSTRSTVLAVTVMVPNSLGPAELLLHYGTDDQKNHYLPRLADGRDVPAFALTEPSAGSDAASMTSHGVVCRGVYEGEEVLGIRLNWNKRYITLAAVSTVLGLAFKLEDPDGLLGTKTDYGITCALIPSHLPGVDCSERHDPLGIPFFNGPTHGKDVFVPLDFIIGGAKNAGIGWRMLMDCLAAGRGISLPSLSCGGGQLGTRTVGAYASVRTQFGLPIGRFEGIEEPLARIAGTTYWLDATRRLTVGAIDAGEKPAVLTAICKRWMTEGLRDIVIDGMDIVGGAGIVRGPRNILSAGYVGSPISITVEGANILTRSMIVFGQGALRCHPYAQKEVEAAEKRDMNAFDAAFFGHVGFVFQNVSRATLLAWSGGHLAMAPVQGPTAYYVKQLTRLSAAFALTADVAMGTIGGGLKLKEKITGRLADVLAWLYIGSATVHRFRAEGALERDLPYMRWAAQTALYNAEQALVGTLRNLPMSAVGTLLRVVLFPLGPRMTEPSDLLGAKVARGILFDGEARVSMTGDVFLPPEMEPGLGRLENALAAVIAARPVHQKIAEAVKQKRLERKPADNLADRAFAAGMISQEELAVVQHANAERNEVVEVDAYKLEDFLKMRR